MAGHRELPDATGTPAGLGPRSTGSQVPDRRTHLTRLVTQVTKGLGSLPAIMTAFALVVIWLIGGVFIGLGDNTYELVINTGTSIITFLMVFIIQNVQNRDGAALQTKLDAQSTMLRAIAERLDVTDEEDRLMRLVGVEDAPAAVIDEHQVHVRDNATPL